MSSISLGTTVILSRNWKQYTILMKCVIVYVKMVNAKLRLLGHMINHAVYCLCLYFHEYDSIFKIVISITLFMQAHVFNSQMVINRSWNFQKSYNKNQIFMIIAEIPKAYYCSFFCFLLIIDECIINVWGYTEILAFAFVQYFPSSFKQKLSVMSLQSEWNRKQ